MAKSGVFVVFLFMMVMVMVMMVLYKKEGCRHMDFPSGPPP